MRCKDLVREFSAGRVEAGDGDAVHEGAVHEGEAVVKYSVRMAVLLSCAAGAVVVACGSDDGGAGDTLPPIITTTTTTTRASRPRPRSRVRYEIMAGDSLSEIAKSFNISVDELAAYNNITDPEHIEIGQILEIPQPGATTTIDRAGRCRVHRRRRSLLPRLSA